MFKKFINRESASITSAAFIIAVATLASKFLGVLRDAIFSSHFSGSDMDVYYAAFRVPDFVYNIVVLGALSAGFIPIFARLTSHHKEEEAFRATNNILNIIFVMLSGLTLFAIVLTPQLTDLIAPGYDPEKKKQIVELTRIMFLSPVFQLLSSVLSGMLQSYKRFVIYSISTVVYNLGIILGALILAPEFGLSGLAWGVVFGSLLQVIVQVPSVQMLGFRYRLFIDTKSSEVREIIRLTAPRILTIILSQCNLLVITVIASTLAAGSLADFNYANNLQSFPLSIFALSYAVACFPTLAGLGDKDQREKFTQVLLSTTKQILYFVIPLSIFMVIFRAQIVRVILGHGRFDWPNTIATMDALQLFCVSLFAQSLIPLFSRAFWAKHDSKTPFQAAVLSAAVNLALALKLAPSYGLSGLVEAFTLSSIFNAILLFVLLARRYLTPIGRGFYLVLIQISFAAIASGVVGYQALYAVEPYFGTRTFAGIMAQGAVSGGLSMITYFLLSYLFRIEEFTHLRGAFQRKLRSRYKASELITED